MPRTKVLLVEDEGIVALDIQERLETLGYAVVAVADSGEQAVQLAGDHKPDVVLMDIRLKGATDGVAAAEQIRARYRLPVIYLTAFADEDTVARAKLTQPFGYLLKPIQERELRTTIEMALYKHQAEQQLRASESRYAATLNSIGDAVIAMDRDGCITFINPVAQRLTGWAQDEAVGRPLEEVFRIVNGRTRQKVACPAGRALREQSTVGLEDGTLLLSRAGQEAWIDDCAAPIRGDGADEVSGAVLAFRDVSEKRRAEDERQKLEAKLQQAQKLESLGMLAGGIAHDFNNILMTVMGYSDLAIRDLTAAHDKLEQVMQGARRAADLTNQMLAYAGKSKLVPQSVQLSEVVQEIGDLLKVSISKKCVLHMRLAESLPLIEADATQLRQVVMNLIINASEAIGEQSGAITVRTSTMTCDRAYLADCHLAEELPAGLYVCLEVADTGCGMAPETRAKIFDPFFTTKFTGRGLGLAAVLGIIRGHRGTIRIDSEPGQGTTFRVLFPAFRQPLAALALPDKKATVWQGTGTVLVVDDEEWVRTLARKMLERLGFTVLTAAHGREAVEIYRAHAAWITAVLLDLTMPQMDGAETFHELKLVRDDVRVIISSGYGEQHALTLFAGMGLAGFVAKPYSLDELSSTLRKVLT
jgi:two-component system cell cycle sensor histidine kinase/response regulator CckA